MGLISRLRGIVAMIWMVVASTIPLVGRGNCFLIPFAAVGATIAAIDIAVTAASPRAA